MGSLPQEISQGSLPPRLQDTVPRRVVLVTAPIAMGLGPSALPEKEEDAYDLLSN